MNQLQSSAALFASPAAKENPAQVRYGWQDSSARNEHAALSAPNSRPPVQKVFVVLDYMKQTARVANNFVDVAVTPGRNMSDAFAERERMRGMLITSVGRFAAEADDRYKISDATATAAKGLIQALGTALALPKIAPDSEGGLIAIWDDHGSRLALVIDDWKLHLVTDAATSAAEYFDDLPFDGVRLPEQVAVAIPRV